MSRDPLHAADVRRKLKKKKEPVTMRKRFIGSSLRIA